MHKTIEKTKLFAEFPSVTSKEWMQKINEDLKGIPFGKFTWEYAEKTTIDPFYMEEDITGLEYLNAVPGSFPFVRSAKQNLNDWKIRHDIDVDDISNANEKAHYALTRGATSINFNIPEKLHLDAESFNILIHGLFYTCRHINFYAPGKETSVLNFLIKYIRENNIKPADVFGSIITDPLGYLASMGRFYNEENEDFNIALNLIRQSDSSLPNFKFIGINGQIFHNAGGSVVQELAFSLACASEYLDRFTSAGLTADKVAESFLLHLSVGPLYFIEIAKFRAARLLFAHLIKAWNPNSDNSAKIFIHATTSEWNQTVFDPYVNILRGTTESMSAIIGGADSLNVTPYNNPSGKKSVFGDRISRNTQIVLKEEAFFDKVIDPGAGSYYIEKLTDTIAEQAWKLFLDIENMGGFSKAFKAGAIQQMIKSSSLQRDKNIASKKEILLGVNHYPEPSGKVLDGFKVSKLSDTNVSGNIIAPPLVKYRGAFAFEEIRLKTLNAGKRKPKVFLLPYGNVTWRIARTAFSSNFFGCAGYEIIENSGFATIKEGIEAAISSGSSIVVLCSSDEQYMLIAPEAKELLGKKTILVIAGLPKDSVDDLTSLGIEHFIHVRSNVPEELRKYNDLLGIK